MNDREQPESTPSQTSFVGTKTDHAAMRCRAHFWVREARRLATAALILAVVRSRRLESYARGEWGKGIKTQVGLTDFWLMGSALEALLKADRARETGPPPEQPTESWIANALKRISRHGHNLRQIAKERGLSLDEREEVLLGDITQVLQWRARYSLPKKTSNFDEPSLGGEHWQRLCEIVERAACRFSLDLDLEALRKQAFAELGLSG